MNKDDKEFINKIKSKKIIKLPYKFTYAGYNVTIQDLGKEQLQLPGTSLIYRYKAEAEITGNKNFYYCIYYTKSCNIKSIKKHFAKYLDNLT